MDTLPPITRLYRSCNPVEAIEPSDLRWVDLSAARGCDHVVQKLVRSIRRADPHRSEIKLFPGHIGVGKSSALNEAKALLEEAFDNRLGFIVIKADIQGSLDTNDLDFPDLLVFLAGVVQNEMKERLGKGYRVKSVLIDQVWERVKSALGSEVDISAEAGVDFAKLALQLRHQPTHRLALRQKIEAQQASLLNAVNDLLATARVDAINQGYSGIVLLVDGLDKLARTGPGGDTTINLQERLFFDRAEQLNAIEAIVVYTVPISLVYSPRFGAVEQILGEHFMLLSVIPMSRYDGNSDGEQGFNVMKLVLQRRCEHAGVPFEQLCDSASTLRYLCQMSGGHPRHLMMLLQSAINDSDTLPLTKANVETAVRHYANSLSREIADEGWPALRRFDRPQRDIPKDELHLQALFLAHIFEYMNGEPWYEVNPVIRTLKRFAT